MKNGIPNIEQGRDRRLLDDLVEAYVTWRERSTDVRDAYARWSRRSDHHDDEAFYDYRDALDSEERAAAAYQVLIERVQHACRRASRDRRSAWWVELAIAVAVASLGVAATLVVMTVGS